MKRLALLLNLNLKAEHSLSKSNPRILFVMADRRREPSVPEPRGSGRKRRKTQEEGLEGDAPDDRPSTSGQAATLDPELFLPTTLPFKLVQTAERYPKGALRHWKRLKQIVQGENYHLLPADEPTYANIEAPPSMYPAKKYCDMTGFEAKYTDPRTKMRYADAEAFKFVRALPDATVQAYLTLRNAAVVLR
ncbi:hypothetical protein KFL_003640050 [Klebsormidium nitens]|uniref:Vps72/YL1 C-terminal domain-containing protein n=1 Tax=Klebsormidium nitens TaxID=105231 RepID=A0A1Y1IAK7_KLENI|nr:hypothetical protein KFL_003640050 [Klebsormidium nitens]|eukprot:GAQ87603.1 hypothetical protein KFL_003640050 [Klebsormidium nitens]